MPRFIVALSIFFFASVIPAQSQMLPLLPNHFVTPGVTVSGITLRKICRTKWGKDARHVTTAMKRQVFANYGLTGNKDPACIRDAHGRRCEIDHLISRELGGADDEKISGRSPMDRSRGTPCVRTASRRDCTRRCARDTSRSSKRKMQFVSTGRRHICATTSIPNPGKSACLERTRSRPRLGT